MCVGVASVVMRSQGEVARWQVYEVRRTARVVYTWLVRYTCSQVTVGLVAMFPDADTRRTDN